MANGAPTVDELLTVYFAAQRWARAHELHHLDTTIEHRGPERYVPRDAYLAAEAALLDVLKEGGR